MTGYSYGDSAPVQDCPYCGADCHADFVDIGIGFTQCGPYYCQVCGASEIGPYDPPRELTDVEREKGWYGPGKPVSDLANTVNGAPVNHKRAMQEYAAGTLDPWGPKPYPVRGGAA